MNIKLAWVVDPKTKETSVSLTNLVLSVLMLVTTHVLAITDKVKNNGLAEQYFWGSAALYFGRRFSIKGQEFNAEKTESEKT